MALAAARPVRATPPGLDVCWSVGPYAGVLRDLVTALKFGSLTAVARVAARAMARAPGELPEGVLVPVPAAPRRLRRRGFDPAGEIARALAELRGLPLTECLRRADGPRQVGRPRAERTSLPPRVRLAGSRPPPRRAILVDDVWTTGATLTACAQALRAGGSVRVAAITLAHTR
jgi:predicted amidophosphoribosyltransferase